MQIPLPGDVNAIAAKHIVSYTSKIQHLSVVKNLDTGQAAE